MGIYKWFNSNHWTIFFLYRWKRWNFHSHSEGHLLQCWLLNLPIIWFKFVYIRFFYGRYHGTCLLRLCHNSRLFCSYDWERLCRLCSYLHSTHILVCWLGACFLWKCSYAPRNHHLSCPNNCIIWLLNDYKFVKFEHRNHCVYKSEQSNIFGCYRHLNHLCRVGKRRW